VAKKIIFKKNRNISVLKAEKAENTLKKHTPDESASAEEDREESEEEEDKDSEEEEEEKESAEEMKKPAKKPRKSASGKNGKKIAAIHIKYPGDKKKQIFKFKIFQNLLNFITSK
jgi:hypothetical protein